MKLGLFLLAVAAAHCTIHFKETFDDESYEKRWVYSDSKGADAGKFALTAGKFYGDEKRDQGIQTSQDAKFYQYSSKIETPFSNEGKPLVLQYQVKHEQNIDCGGGYIKIFPESLTPASMTGDSPYNIMFGPDICGPGTKKVHVIFTYKGKNLLTKKDIRCKDDEMTHLYTLILNPDNTYEVLIDNEKVESGSLEEDFDFLEPKKIKDPAASKPADWVDTAKMDDPEDVKPEGYDKPELISDPEATKPEDWDDEEDGEWEPPMINNPEYKGEWKPKQIDNPAYKGAWVHPETDNPKYEADDSLYRFTSNAHVGFELWQVKSGTIFDNIIVTDDVAEAKEFADKTFGITKVEEKKMKDKLDEEEKKKREEEDKKKEAESKDSKKDATEEEEEEEEEEDTAEEPEEKIAEEAKDEL
jgi:calreticulin